LIADRRQWFDRPSWGVTLIVVGLAALATGFLLNRQARVRRADDVPRTVLKRRRLGP
jgi:hypothetical protein